MDTTHAAEKRELDAIFHAACFESEADLKALLQTLAPGTLSQNLLGPTPHSCSLD